jgi:hypothetical protein
MSVLTRSLLVQRRELCRLQAQQPGAAFAAHCCAREEGRHLRVAEAEPNSHVAVATRTGLDRVMSCMAMS